MLEGKCHCGAAGFRIAETPEKLVDCNCSICRKLGVLWAHMPVETVEILGEAGATSAYAHGARNLAFHTCRTCGCTTHWSSLKSDAASVVAVNCQLIAPAEIAEIQIRRFDGAESWTFLDE